MFCPKCGNRVLVESGESNCDQCGYQVAEKYREQTTAKVSKVIKMDRMPWMKSVNPMIAGILAVVVLLTIGVYAVFFKSPSKAAMESRLRNFYRFCYTREFDKAGDLLSRESSLGDSLSRTDLEYHLEDRFAERIIKQEYRKSFEIASFEWEPVAEILGRPEKISGRRIKTSAVFGIQIKKLVIVNAKGEKVLDWETGKKRERTIMQEGIEVEDLEEIFSRRVFSPWGGLSDLNIDFIRESGRWKIEFAD